MLCIINYGEKKKFNFLHIYISFSIKKLVMKGIMKKPELVFFNLQMDEVMMHQAELPMELKEQFRMEPALLITQHLNFVKRNIQNHGVFHINLLWLNKF